MVKVRHNELVSDGLVHMVGAERVRRLEQFVEEKRAMFLQAGIETSENIFGTRFCRREVIVGEVLQVFDAAPRNRGVAANPVPNTAFGELLLDLRRTPVPVRMSLVAIGVLVGQPGQLCLRLAFLERDAVLGNDEKVRRVMYRTDFTGGVVDQGEL